jgi:hypothetical protein
VKLVCAPPGHAALSPTRGIYRVELYGRSHVRGVGSVGATLYEVVRRRGLVVTPRAWDLLSTALSVIAADTACMRETSPDGWTRQIALTIAVTEPTFWVKQRPMIERMLRFLTTDIWVLEFIDGGTSAPMPRRSVTVDQQAVSLLSGGLDSLVGVIDLAAADIHPFVVSQVSAGDKDTQRHFAATIGGGLDHLQLNHNVAVPQPTERSQRSRSLGFLAYGVLAATCLSRYGRGDAVVLYVPENGFISLNPPLTPDRLGSLSTRTTHPTFLAAFQELLDAAGLHIQIENPLQFKTKGEALAGCRDQEYLKRNAVRSTSCGRYARNAFQHCGRCVPCLIRRAAFRHWGERDRTGYRFGRLSTKDKEHAFYDDVRSMAMALERVRQDGVDELLSSCLDSRAVPSTQPYRDVIERSVQEIAAFFRAMRIQ